MPLTAIHPGKQLAEELKELGMSAAELARQLDVPTNRVTEILNGRRAITGDTALRLAHFFGTTAEFWPNLQSLYELRVAQKKAGKSIRGVADPETPRTGTRIGRPWTRESARRAVDNTLFSPAQMPDPGLSICVPIITQVNRWTW
jgi:addiction module HigA family antidote